MELLRNSEEPVMCPYNSAHYVRRKVLEMHLIVCRRNYTGGILKQCNFNTAHVIPEPELQYHHETCPDRVNVELVLNGEDDSYVREFPVHHVPVPTDDSWDEEPVPNYNPEEYCRTNNVLRCNAVDTRPPAERKNFRMEERRRLAQFSGSNVPEQQRYAARGKLVSNDQLPPVPNFGNGPEVEPPLAPHAAELMRKFKGWKEPYIPNE